MTQYKLDIPAINRELLYTLLNRNQKHMTHMQRLWYAFLKSNAV